MKVRSTDSSKRDILSISEHRVNSADFGIRCRLPFEASSAFEFMRSTFC